MTIFIVIILLVVLVMSVSIISVVSGQSSAQTTITSAKNTLKNAYDVAKQAEDSAANIESLANSLNIAADLLSKAEIAYAANEYDLAYTYAIQSQAQLDNIVNQASTLKEKAVTSKVTEFVFDILSISVSIGIASAGIAIWAILGKQKGEK